jgi:hypothetical protein
MKWMGDCGMYWYKVRVRDGQDGDYSYMDSMEITPEELAEKISKDTLIRLDNLLYWDGNIFRDWNDWDSTVEPFKYLRAEYVITFTQYKSDPRLMTKEQLNCLKGGRWSRLFNRS